MLTRDEDVLAAAESWREAGRDVAIATVVGSLLADIAYAVLDPRVRYA